MDVIVFLGIQGSGKGTQAMLLAKKLEYTHINIGDIFRKHISEETELGETVKHIIHEGSLVPDELVFDLVDATITGRCKGLIFDGFPRTRPQAEFLLKHYNVLRVFYLEIGEAEALDRISTRLVCKGCGSNFNNKTHLPAKEGICDHCGHKLMIRPDDKPAAIHKRFKEFYKETYPLKQFFAEKELLVELHASSPIKLITETINKEIASIRG